jgi:hypothetical protein
MNRGSQGLLAGAGGVTQWVTRPVGRWSLHRLDIGMGVCALAWFVYLPASVWSGELTTGDDAFITFQYASNLVRGLGLVFNAGERVWGFTSPVQAIVLGALTDVGFDTVHVAFFTRFLRSGGQGDDPLAEGVLAARVRINPGLITPCSTRVARAP